MCNGCVLTTDALQEHHEDGQSVGAVHRKVEDPEPHDCRQCDLRYQQKSDVNYLRYNKLSRCHSRDH